MSFFQSLKEDLSTAVNEIIDDGMESKTVLASDEPGFSDSGLMLTDPVPAEDEIIDEQPDAVNEDTENTVALEESVFYDNSVRSALDSLKNASRRYEESLANEVISDNAEAKAEDSQAEETASDISNDSDEVFDYTEADLDALIKSLTENMDDAEKEDTEGNSELPSEAESEEIENSIDEEAEPEVSEIEIEAEEAETKEYKEDEEKADEPVQLEFNLDDMLRSIENQGLNLTENESEIIESEEVVSEVPATEEVVAEEKVVSEITEEANETTDQVFDDLMREYKEKFKTSAEESAPATEVIQEPVNEVKEVPVEKPVKPKKSTKSKKKPAKTAETKVTPLEEMEMSDETAVIAAGMKIVGNIESAGNIDLAGEICGNVSLLGKLDVTGKINGNTKAFEVFADAAKINGDIVSNGSVKLGQGTVVIGDIIGASAVIAGAVKGDIDVHGPVILDSSAIVMGNIKSMSVQINNGAIIEGLCSQCYATVNPTAFFDGFRKGN